LYQNQVYVTDNVEGIVPEFLMMLRGVVGFSWYPECSRSGYRQMELWRKFQTTLLKVADKLKLFTENRADFEAKWNDIKIVLEYGMLSEDKFYEKADSLYYIQL
jgi:molecular chaperone HtpG